MARSLPPTATATADLRATDAQIGHNMYGDDARGSPSVLTIEMRTTGPGAKRAPSFGVPLPSSLGDHLTLRELIALAVREELAAFAERRIEQTFSQALSERRLADSRSSGRFQSGQRRTAPPPSPEVAVGTAIEAFEDGLFLVLVDGRQETELDAPVLVGPDSSVTFVRLVALAGG